MRRRLSARDCFGSRPSTRGDTRACIRRRPSKHRTAAARYSARTCAQRDGGRGGFDGNRCGLRSAASGTGTRESVGRIGRERPRGLRTAERFAAAPCARCRTGRRICGRPSERRTGSTPTELGAALIRDRGCRRIDGDRGGLSCTPAGSRACQRIGRVGGYRACGLRTTKSFGAAPAARCAAGGRVAARPSQRGRSA